ncbi:MAG: helix-turn-helix transcriptional regulator [Coriobacteriia bacterium]|nr:helix-turn-helix transcriptional regulator [Coriobacteriia bacterium]
MMLALTKARKSRGLSQAKLARLADLHPSTISNIETGNLKPWKGQLKKIASALGWDSDPQELLTEIKGVDA